MNWVDWVILVIRVVVVFFALLIAVMLYIWMERKVIADMQTRVGPMRAGPRGILITLADGIKLFFKEGIDPTNADRGVYLLAPVLAMFPGFLAFAVIPFGTAVVHRRPRHPVPARRPQHRHPVDPGDDLDRRVRRGAGGLGERLELPATGRRALQRADDLLRGGHEPRDRRRRSCTAAASASTRSWPSRPAPSICSGSCPSRAGTSGRMFPAFVVFFIGALAETNRPPFDLAEAETELVAGFHTEYSGIQFAMFYLGEYVNTVTVAAVAVTLFLGGWQGPWFHHFLPWLGPLLWFLLKLTGVIYLMILVRATLPRMRYDRLMNFGWKVLIPFGLVWVMVTGLVVVLPDHFSRRAILIGGAVILGVLALLSLLLPAFSSTPATAPREEVHR